MTTTRETADHSKLQKMQIGPDHIGEANEKVADHVGDATAMIDHAELSRLAQAAEPYWHAANLACGGNPIAVDLVAPFVGAMSPAVCSALLSERAALRGERDGFCPDGAELPTWPELAAYWKDRATQAEAERDGWTANYDRATRLHASTCRDLAQAERQRDELRKAVTAICIEASRPGMKPQHLLRVIAVATAPVRAFLANQGADHD